MSRSQGKDAGRANGSGKPRQARGQGAGGLGPRVTGMAAMSSLLPPPCSWSTEVLLPSEVLIRPRASGPWHRLPETTLGTWGATGVGGGGGKAAGAGVGRVGRGAGAGMARGQEEGLMEKRRHTGRAAAPGRWGKAEVQHGAQWSTGEERTSTDPDKTLESEDGCCKAKPSKVKSPLQTLQR